MRRLAWLLGGIVGLLLVSALVLVLLLPRILESEGVRSRLEQVARESTGREVGWSELQVGLFPPRLRVLAPRVGEAEEPLSFSAEEVALEAALWPLLTGNLLVDRVAISGARVALERSADGLLHPFSPREPTEPASPGEASQARRDAAATDETAAADGEAASPDREASAAGSTETAAANPSPSTDDSADLGFDLREVVVRDARVHLVDRTLDPPVTWQLDELEAKARGDITKLAMDFELRTRLQSGGSLSLDGRLGLDGAAEAEATLQDVALGALRPYVDAATELAGAASGTISWRRGDGPDAIQAELDVASARLEAEGASLAGPLRVKLRDLRLASPPTAELELSLDPGTIRADSTSLDGRVVLHARQLSLGSPPTANLELRLESGTIRADSASLEGPVVVRARGARLGTPFGADLEVDAGGASLASGDSFAKPAGVPATLRGQLVERGGGFALQTGRARLGDVELELDVETAPRTRARVVPASVELEALAAFLPDLAELGATGRLDLGKLEISAEPVQLRGDTRLEGVVVPQDDGPAIRLDGVVRGLGSDLHAPDLVVRIAEQPLHLDARVLDFAGAPRLDASLRGNDLDSQALLRAFDPEHDTLSGPLRLDGRLRGPASGEQALAQADGGLRFEITPGRLRNVSILKLAFEDLSRGAAGAVLSQRGADLEQYEEDTFESLSGSISIAAGRARTDDLRLVYRHYTVDLRGTVGLVDQALDLTGEITLDPEIDAALAGDPDPQSKSGKRKVFPLARVTGTIESPRVVLGEDAALRFASAYIRDERRRRKWEGKIDERLGEGSGEAVLDALDELLRGKTP